MRGGYLTVGRFHGAPVRFHVSIPIGALVFTGFTLRPGAWIGFVALILFHELGHALLCRAYRLRVVGIDVHGLGGECRYRAHATPWQQSVVAWGGVLAQALVLAATLAARRAGLVSATPFAFDLAGTFVATNAYLIAVNLLPVPPLDGAAAWRLVPLALRRLRRRSRPSPATARRPLAPLSTETEAHLREVLTRARDIGKKN